MLGIGVGCDESDRRAYGYDFPPARERVEQLEAIQIIRALWSEPKATFEGRHRKVEDARCEPRPNPPPLVMIGAFRPRMLRLVARYADCWNVASCGPVRYGSMAAELERACAEMGRDPFTIRRTWIGGFACAKSTGGAQALAACRSSAENDFDDFGFVGTAEQIAGQMRGFVEQGVDYFMLDMAHYRGSRGLRYCLARWFRRCGAEVRPGRYGEIAYRVPADGTVGTPAERERVRDTTRTS